MVIERLASVEDRECSGNASAGARQTASITLFGLPLLSASPDRAVDHLLETPRCRAAFVNAHCVNLAATDAEYRAALSSAELLLPDGAGVELAARLHGKRFAANLNGTDLCPLVLARAAECGRPVYLLGGRPGVADAAAAILMQRYPSLRVVGTRDGYAGARDTDVIEAINDSGADILLVAMGVPLQDVWLARHHDKLKPGLVIGVGAFLDFSAGRVRRAPRWMRRIRLEWLWRLGLEPRRLFGRYVIGNALFLWRAIRHRRHARAMRRG